jgi:hypothetical protein
VRVSPVELFRVLLSFKVYLTPESRLFVGLKVRNRLDTLAVPGIDIPIEEVRLTTL